MVARSLVVVALIGLVGAAFASPSDAAGKSGSYSVQRSEERVEPVESLPEGVDSELRVLEVKMVERPGGDSAAERLVRALENVSTSNDWPQVSPGETGPLFTISTERLEALRTSEDSPNLSLWHWVQVPEGVDPVGFAARLNGEADVAHAALPAVHIVSAANSEDGNTSEPNVDNVDRATRTPDFDGRRFQGYLDSAKKGGVDARYSWTVPGGTGKGVAVYAVEFDLVRHEDLRSVRSVGPLLREGDEHRRAPKGSIERSHGTGTLGIIGAARNGFGITGIAYEADLRLSPIDTVFYPAASGFGIPNAILLAAEDGKPGDVIVTAISSRTIGGKCEDGVSLPVEARRSVFEAIRVATDNGVTVVQAASNSGADLDTACGRVLTRKFRDSGAIIVGAGTPPRQPLSEGDRSRRPESFSAFGERVDLQGWGSEVATTGVFDDLFFDPNDPAKRSRWYTGQYDGTSSASAMVAGVVASLQGVAVAEFGEPLSPFELRRLLVDTGTPQRGRKQIGPLPNLRAAIENLMASDGPGTLRGADDDAPKLRDIQVETTRQGTSVVVSGRVVDPGSADDLFVTVRPGDGREPRPAIEVRSLERGGLEFLRRIAYAPGEYRPSVCATDGRKTTCRSLGVIEVE